MASAVYAHGTKEVLVAAGEKLAIYSLGSIQLYVKAGYPNLPDTYDLETTTAGGDTYTTAAMVSATTYRIEASAAIVYYETGASPSISEPQTDITAADATFNIAGLAAAQGGYVRRTGGTSATSANAGGAIEDVGGTPGLTGVGGAVTAVGGAGGATSGTGGAITHTGGAGTAGNAIGGAVIDTGGAGQGSAAGGAVTHTGGAGGATGAGGAVAMTGGAGGATSGAGGTAAVVGGAASNGDSAGGAAALTGGAGEGTGAGGTAAVVGGASGAGATGNGGSVSLTGGAAASTNGNGGNVVLTGGALAGTGIDGHVVCRDLLVIPQGAPSAKTTTAALTIAELKTSIVTITHTAGATQEYALPAGAAIDAAMAIAVGDAFDWSLINLSAAAVDTATITSPGADHTLVGNAIVQSVHSTTGLLYGSSGLFRTRKTAADTFVTYRIA